MLANVVGTDGRSFKVTWYDANNLVVHTEKYDRFSALAHNQGLSRIWGGIHFKFEIDASEVACTQVADFIFDNYMRPRKFQRRK